MQEIKTKKCRKMYLIYFKRLSDCIKYLAGYLISFWSLPRNHFKDLTLKVAWCFNLPWFCMNSCRFGGQFRFSSNKQNLLSECIDIQIQPNLGFGKTKEYKEEGQCAQKWGRMLIFVIYGIIKNVLPNFYFILQIYKV